MATIVGGIATSHTPTIGFALDAKKHNDPVWAPIFAGYKPVQEWLARKKPDVLFVIYNDHITSFFFDHYSQFALGVGSALDALSADRVGSLAALQRSMDAMTTTLTELRDVLTRDRGAPESP